MRTILHDILTAIWNFFKIPPLQGQPENEDDSEKKDAKS
jgi:hypothetical protein